MLAKNLTTVRNAVGFSALSAWIVRAFLCGNSSAAYVAAGICLAREKLFVQS